MSADPVRWLWAAAVVAVWLILTGWIIWRARRRPETAGEGGNLLIAVASQTGFGDELAEVARRMLAEAGQSARVAALSGLEAADLIAARRVLFIASTTGEGDAPDSAARFVRRTMAAGVDLSGVSYGLLSLGDRSYRDFCGFGRALDGWLKGAGAAALFETVEVDNGDASAIRRWQGELAALTGGVATAEWTAPDHAPWRLVERRLLNPGSPGEAAWHLGFEPPAAGLDWQAGDIVELVGPSTDDGPALREYSVASLPSDGRVELLVRRMHRPDGTPGLVSGWLTGSLAVGDAVPMRLRANAAFRAPPSSTPMILIGNGTGLAGLRSHLKARAAEPGSAQTWLMFGERTAEHDAFHDAELRGWLASGALTRLDRTFSRDPGDGRYVQALITENADTVRDWIRRGAALYICGSLEGMAGGVNLALEDVLGATALRDLVETGRYRRDVY
ncbi:sulfite reductase subunit alpha [Brevundimonas subvibrioides]|uniref:sulfite reductase subunit alpha n=1 Tax=Brevundimonas subvibrioides TaxID=74313 RepID=UPI0032D5AD73